MSRWLQLTLSLVILCMAGSMTQAADTQPHQLTVRQAWARATAPGMTMGAAYMTLQGGAKADRLVSATTPRAVATQLHVITTAAGMTRMREAGEVAVPATATVSLAPQGTHLMLIDLTRPLVAGERFPMTLRFAHAGALTVNVQVLAPGDEPTVRP